MKASLELFMLGVVLLGMQLSPVAAQTSAEPAPSDVSVPLPPEPGASQPAAPSESPAPAPGPRSSSIFEEGATESRPVDPKRTANNVLFAELLGNGGIYSVNYERFFIDNISGRIGFGYISLSASSGNSSSHASILFIPLMVNYMGIGSADHKFELGIGPLLVNASTGASGVGSTAAHSSGFGIAGTATIGYRYVPHDGGFNFKVGFTPIFGAGGFLPWGGLGLGAVF